MYTGTSCASSDQQLKQSVDGVHVLTSMLSLTSSLHDSMCWAHTSSSPVAVPTAVQLWVATSIPVAIPVSAKIS